MELAKPSPKDREQAQFSELPLTTLLCSHQTTSQGRCSAAPLGEPTTSGQEWQEKKEVVPAIAYVTAV